MTNCFYILNLGLILLTSCEHECRVIKDTYANKKEKEVLIYADCDDTTYYLRQHFYENGQMSSEGHLKNGIRIGKFKSWAENGKQTADWEVLDGKENGFIQCWYDNGVKKRESTLDKGVENGYFKEWNQNGKLEIEGNYSKGNKTGIWKYYEENGSWKIRNYESDTLQGQTFEHLVDSASVKLVFGQYEHGKEVGLWKWLDKDSILYQTAVMSDGKYTGEYIKYYKNGKFESKGNLIDSEYEGEVVYYDENGNITKTVTYKNGKLQHTRKN